MTIRWQEPYQDGLGGYLRHQAYADAVEGKYADGVYPCGWWTYNNNGIYDAFDYRDYFCFSNLGGTTYGTLNSVILYINLSHKFVVEGVTSNTKIDVYSRSMYEADDYPWSPLEATDDHYSTYGWEYIGTLGTISSLGSTGWCSVDVTSAVQRAVDNDWSKVAFMLKPDQIVPADWDYSYPLSSEEACYAIFYGAGTNVYGSSLPGTYGVDVGVSDCYYYPKIKIDCGDSGAPTPSPVNCVAADPKAKIYLAGTESGKLWLIRYSGSSLYRTPVHQSNSAITALYMDWKKNYLDNPNTQVTWFGTDSGWVYRSNNSLAQFFPILNTGESIKEIRGSNEDSDKVVIGSGNNLYITRDGGVHWETKSLGYAFSGVFVCGDEIQVVASGHVNRSTDFGANWSAAVGEPASAKDITFSSRNPRDSMLLSDGYLYKNSNLTGTFSYSQGSAIVGEGTCVVADDEMGVALIGTDSMLLKTTNWGSTVVPLIFEPVTDIAIGTKTLYQS